MKSILKAATLESKFPLLAVENDCIVSKDADITVAYRVELPELFTVTSAEYEAIHAAWAKAIKVLPNFTVIHKQDFFTEESYQSSSGEMTFLSRSFERHFNERPCLGHTCYLFITKTTRERTLRRSDFNTLTRRFIVPREAMDGEAAARFLEACAQFERIVGEGGMVRLARLTEDEIVGTDTRAGIIERYFSLCQHDAAVLEDIAIDPGALRVGDKMVCLHTLSDAEELPGRVSTDARYERLSTDRSDCLLSFAAPVGVLLPCNHVVNQYIFIDDSAENLRRFERQARNMHSLARYSRANQINREWIEEYLNEAHSQGLTSVRAHANVMAWSEDAAELRRIKNEVGGQIACGGRNHR